MVVVASKVTVNRKAKTDERHLLWMLMRHAVRIIAKARDRELQHFGITGDMIAVLFTIALLGKDAIPATISRTLFLEPNSVSQQLTKMERMGLIHKSRDPQRRNSIHVELTEAGRDIYRRSNRGQSVRRLMSALDEGERRQMWLMLAKLRDAGLKELGVKKPILYPPSDPSQPR